MAIASRPDLVSFNAALASVAASQGRVAAGPSAGVPRRREAGLGGSPGVVGGAQGGPLGARRGLRSQLRGGKLEDLFSFNTALDTCTHSQRWEEALCLVEDMKRSQRACQEVQDLLGQLLQPDLHCVTAVASVCGHAGEWRGVTAQAQNKWTAALRQRAFAFAAGSEPDALLYSALGNGISGSYWYEVPCCWRVRRATNGNGL